MKKTFLLAVIGFSNILTAQITTFVSGGQEVDISKVPHQVSLQLFGRNNCGGSIIGNKWVLTAAHCVDTPIKATYTSIKAGITKLNTPISTTRNYQIARVILHPNYNSNTLHNDIALLELTQDIEFNSNTQPIRLADNNDLYNVGRNTKVSGWGLPAPGANNGSNELRIVEVPIMSNSDAQRYYRSTISNNMMATHPVSNNRKGTCEGDSGGALTTIDANGQVKQIGIVSWGTYRCTGGLRSPSIYTKVANYIDWIKQYVPATFEIYGKKVVCNIPQTYTVDNPNGGTLQWELPNSVEKISETSNTITINAKQGYSGWATLKASNGTTQTNKKIWVGSAPVSFEMFTFDDEKYATFRLVSTEPELSLEDFGINDNSLTCEYTFMPNYDAVLHSATCMGGTIQAHPLNTTEPIVGLSVEVKSKPNDGCINIHWAGTMIVKNYNIPDNIHLYSVSPNPANDVVNISLSNLGTMQNKMKTTTSVTPKLSTPTYGELFDNMGRRVAQVQIINGKAQLNVSQLSGIYILQITTNGHTEQHKIIIK